MAIFQKRSAYDPIAQLEADLKTAVDQANRLQTKRGLVAEEAAAAEMRLRSALSDDDDESAAAAARDLESSRSTAGVISALIIEQNEKTAAAEAALADALDRRARLAKADDLDALGKEITSVSAAFLSAAGELAALAARAGWFQGNAQADAIRGFAKGLEESGLPALKTEMRDAASALRADPPKRALQPPPPAKGEWSGVFKPVDNFDEAEAPGAYGHDNRPVPANYGGAAGKG